MFHFNRNVREIFFLHINKAAGTETKRYLREINNREPSIRFEFEKKAHTVFLGDLPESKQYLFTIRNPITRFSSAFYSKKRKGAPLRNSEWTAQETLAFQNFEHANDLAESLFSAGPKGLEALKAIKSLSSTARSQIDWFIGQGHFLETHPPIHILRQEKFDFDLENLMVKLGIEPFVIQKDPVKSHVFNYENVPALSDLAINNLQRWYSQDIVFYEMCSNWIDGQRS